MSTKVQNNPTYEFYPKKGGAVNMKFLDETVPLNLFPLTWLMPSGPCLSLLTLAMLTHRQAVHAGRVQDHHV